MIALLEVPHGAEPTVPIIAAAQGEIGEGGSSTCEGRKVRKGRTADKNPRAGWQDSGSRSMQQEKGRGVYAIRAL